MTKYKFDKKLEAESLRYIAEHEIPADEEEKADFEYWKTITPEDIPDMEQEEHDRILAQAKEAQANYRREHPSYKSAQKKDKGLYIRINSDDLEKFKQEALKQGLSYQTYLTFLISQVNNHRLNIKAEFTKKTGTDNK